MMSSKTITMLCMVALLLINSAFGARITVKNQCPYEVSCAVVDGVDLTDGTDPAPPPKPDFRPVSREGLDIEPKDNLGQTLMCGKTGQLPDIITQLEWMHKTTDNTLWFDGSIIHGHPFKAEGFTVKTGYQQPPTGTSWPRCWDIWCDRGVDCPSNQVYTTPTDDRSETDNPMRDCPSDTHLIWHICLDTAEQEEKKVLGPPV